MTPIRLTRPPGVLEALSLHALSTPQLPRRPPNGPRSDPSWGRPELALSAPATHVGPDRSRSGIRKIEVAPPFYRLGQPVVYGKDQFIMIESNPYQVLPFHITIMHAIVLVTS
ncbi:hypothetical protein PGTUg99_005986 [Puccinia graminis f. sp. tritici]|uniref:Uncharacterized protein n=1 Tax=Puccinia graminis f. sp. tritici TaxID=56615 RepID=A0A5B0RQL2_PUCGR|nr:hypothetical protein PGTUg99_005986 [Puccinia graminis f. sp. tritici]